MKASTNKIFITGGATGIGLALAKRFINNNIVIVCGRRQEKPNEANAMLPSLVTISATLAIKQQSEYFKTQT